MADRPRRRSDRETTSERPWRGAVHLLHLACEVYLGGDWGTGWDGSMVRRGSARDERARGGMSVSGKLDWGATNVFIHHLKNDLDGFSLSV